MSDDTRGPLTEDKPLLARKLDSAGWGLFFIWVGIAALASVGWGIGLLGVGVIMLGSQGVRRALGLPVEAFGVVMGALFFLGGVWRLLGVELGRPVVSGALVPVLCIVAGALLLASALRRPAGPIGP